FRQTKMGRATLGYSASRRRVGDQMGRWQGEFCAAGEIAAALPVRRLQRGVGYYGQSLQSAGTPAYALSLSTPGHDPRRHLWDSTPLGRWACDGDLFFRLSGPTGGRILRRSST